jgi:hypothetical protein
MKYYFNFIGVPNEMPSSHYPDFAGELNNSYRFPTDPQYKQDGVYNQRCKYRITNLSIENMLLSDIQFLNGKSMIVRFNDIPSMNTYNMVARKTGAGFTGFQLLAEQPVEFHIRIPDDKIEQTTSTATTTSNLTIDPYVINVPKGSISDNASAGSERNVSKTNAGDDITGQIVSVAGASNTFLRNEFALNSFTEEIIGASCWGQVPNISFFLYSGNSPATNFRSSPALDDITIAFTLEVEPVAVKL